MGFSPLAIELANDPRFRGPFEEFTVSGTAGQVGEGPYFQLWCSLQEETVVKATYQSHGCISSMAVGGGLCRLLTGRNLSQARLITIDDLKVFVGPVPEGKEFCFILAIDALDKALGQEGV